MAAFPAGDVVILQNATNSQALDSQSSQSEHRQCEALADDFHSEADCGAATQTDDGDEQGLTFVNSHVAVNVSIGTETSGYDPGQGPEVVGVPLSNLGGWKVKVRPSTSSMHCVSFHDLTYQVTQRKCCKRLPDKTILNSVR